MKTEREINKRINQRVTQFHRKIADYLNRKVNEFSQPIKKFVFLFSGIMIALLCLQLIFQSVSGDEVNNEETTDQIVLPYSIQPKNQVRDSISSNKN